MLATKRQFAALVNLFQGGTKLVYKKGEFIIRPGESPSNVFFIESGLVKAYNISKYGEENLLIIRKSHEIFPLIWAITGQERDIIYQAMTQSVIRRLDQQTYLDFLRSHPSALPPILDMVTEMYRIHSERILNLEYRTVRERLISFLLTMAARFGSEVSDGVRINVPLRHQDIASSINSTRETASRQLSILERKGLVGSKQFYITLKDKAALEAYLG
ncbi:MAG TPA: Crp/Fnr family transcriptional regulator [Candidatus Saccharimonadales bacterium]|nr:Crp/Fnr family transcriptional regulator [Candidatus Saccharimonadales bacterium]